MPTKDPQVPILGKDSLGPGFYTPLTGFDQIKETMNTMKSIQEQGLNNYGIKIIHPSP